ncbi:hypothetical protein DRP43_00070 [candidate division TA06 bacterium]|uniref:Uncharacterized protein n=1 Tax=candidate division TA06 bacterium TaxID=2250710 RepID=A0A660SPF3_UNCT6|nr:MAG: hypothetical protein DRP43_00070 [candidate division TA06 bacterium]
MAEELNDVLTKHFQRIKVIFTGFFMEPFILYFVMLLIAYSNSGGINDFNGIIYLESTVVRYVSLGFIVFSVIEYYTIVVIMKKFSTMFGAFANVEEYISIYCRKIILLTSLSVTPSILGFIFYISTGDIIVSTLFYLVALVSLFRVYPRYNIFRDLYIDLTKEDI